MMMCFQDVSDGLLKITEAGDVVTDAAFSPDGTALATASRDGQVKFFQVSVYILARIGTYITYPGTL